MLSTLFGGSSGSRGHHTKHQHNYSQQQPQQQHHQQNHHNSRHATDTLSAPTRVSSHSTEIWNQPPKKVIKATRDYKAQFVNELEFRRGDFFYVIHDLDEFYYEVMNPIARARGLVPRSHFESLDKTANGSDTLHRGGEPRPAHQQQQHQPPATLRRGVPTHDPRDMERPLYGGTISRNGGAEDGYDYRPSHQSISGMTVSTATNYDDYKHESAYTQGSTKSGTSSGTHSSAYSTVHSGEYPVSRSPPPSVMSNSQNQRAVPIRAPSSQAPATRPRQDSLNNGSSMSRSDHDTSNHSNHHISSNSNPHTSSHSSSHHHSHYQASSASSSVASLSKSAPSQSNKGFAGMGRQLPHPVSARVQNDELLSDGRFQYTIELHLSDDTSRVLLRMFDDFYTLHVSLLSQFAAQSGRLKDQPRTIPFLPPAPAQAKINSPLPPPASPSEIARRRAVLDTYLTDLIKLPAPIRHSPALNRFFMLRKDDNMTTNSIKFDTSTALMDLISDYHSYPSLSRSVKVDDDSLVKIKVHLPGDETLAWRIHQDLPFLDFVDEVAEKIRWMHDGWAIWYKDEVGGLVKINGDIDWAVVIRGRWEKVVLYID
ncbi:hypothetical protein DFJ77DRAFT_64886 [Powellomyces hirtus]|nr:hypothetical protein DFJ77DRAFT_64886 [Powellomyces hirtus]